MYGVNGGQYYNRSLYSAAATGAPFPNPHNSSETVLQSPGVARADSVTAEAEFREQLFRSSFNSTDDLVALCRTGTSSSRTLALDMIPSITGQTSGVDNTVEQPNSNAFSPDESLRYVTGLGYADFDDATADGSLPRFDINRRGARNVYTFDCTHAG
ncbi:hypothetical protein DL770_005543 [Monosporascus sp. CRB-9-2]|nr:hypothetical protein DL770_005543 [Monosporascus sp. CRB-9-2]